MNSFYLLKLEYDGTDYLGWQIQPSGKTIQGELNKVLTQISHSEEISSIASGRTDAGVHAQEQVVKVTMPLKIGLPELKRALNSLLPKDIHVRDVLASSENFHPVRDAVSKDYHYRFTTGEESAIQKRYLAHCSYDLNISQMQKACALLVGKHDFVNYFCVGTPVKTTVREIFECQIKAVEANSLTPAHYILMIQGSGFLKQMVRLIMGALWAVGRGKLSLEEFELSLKQPFKDKLAAVAPPEGLLLHRVTYKS